MSKPSVDNDPVLQSLLASVVVHAEEMLSSDGHAFDRAALGTAVEHPSVQAWVKSLGPLAPLKRVSR